MKFETNAIHAGLSENKTDCVVNPIAQTAGFHFESTEQAANAFALKENVNIYSRMNNPTVNEFESRMAALDGGVGALALSSGMTAVLYTILNVCKAGDNFVTSPNLYGGVSMLFHNLAELGIEARFVEHDDPQNFGVAADSRTKLFFGEVLPNPKLNVFPIEEVAKIGEGMGIPLAVDNTCATPYICKPFDFGAHITVYSTTKYLCGHGTSIGGCVVDSGKFDWDRERFDTMTAPNKSYNGMIWARDFGDAGFITKMRAVGLRDMGGCMAPMNAFLTAQGLETLALRMDRHCDNALAVAEYLYNHPKVKSVRYPGISDGMERERADKYLNGKFGGMVGVEVEGGMVGGKAFVDKLELFGHMANIGDVRSMVIHPASTTHVQVPLDERECGGITDGYVRVCVGIEHIDDLLLDLSQALA